ncbi:hypothetical protein CHLRE_13g569050v5 [Chlamydomonas reinhardtii]|uniref:Uncharacterized protein n=1 Tax=Chlamydomonas reinhardtii TaxID=3055 RepID=A0A2K3CZI6_CHLRE|nr:uncharacterized protein CHLRE_13g569050v5 [Chlamydomonas reinhardtii]PNW73700.1 hypothetical protein CHLRE_13g569050v5 [Chlamydomonas reinhardtii]
MDAAPRHPETQQPLDLQRIRDEYVISPDSLSKLAASSGADSVASLPFAQGAKHGSFFASNEALNAVVNLAQKVPGAPVPGTDGHTQVRVVVDGIIAGVWAATDDGRHVGTAATNTALVEFDKGGNVVDARPVMPTEAEAAHSQHKLEKVVQSVEPPQEPTAQPATPDVPSAAAIGEAVHLQKRALTPQSIVNATGPLNTAPPAITPLVTQGAMDHVIEGHAPAGRGMPGSAVVGPSDQSVLDRAFNLHGFSQLGREVNELVGRFDTMSDLYAAVNFGVSHTGGNPTNDLRIVFDHPIGHVVHTVDHRQVVVETNVAVVAWRRNGGVVELVTAFPSPASTTEAQQAPGMNTNVQPFPPPAPTPPTPTPTANSHLTFDVATGANMTAGAVTGAVTGGAILGPPGAAVGLALGAFVGMLGSLKF